MKYAPVSSKLELLHVKTGVPSPVLNPVMGLIQDPQISAVQLVGLRDDNRWINGMIEIKATRPPLSHITSEFVPASDILTG